MNDSFPNQMVNSQTSFYQIFQKHLLQLFILPLSKKKKKKSSFGFQGITFLLYLFTLLNTPSQSFLLGSSPLCTPICWSAAGVSHNSLLVSLYSYSLGDFIQSPDFKNYLFGVLLQNSFSTPFPLLPLFNFSLTNFQIMYLLLLEFLCGIHIFH